MEGPGTGLIQYRSVDLFSLCASSGRRGGDGVARGIDLALPEASVNILDFFSRMRSEGFLFNSGGLGVEPCSRPMFTTVRNRSQVFATVRSRALRRCHWGKLAQVTFHGCDTCQVAPLFHCDLHENNMSRKKPDAFRCTGAAFGEICRLLHSSIGISVCRVVFLGCWMWPCH